MIFRRKQIQLTIADPCHENWDKMSTAEKGRYCSSCQKQVIDFTNMGDLQLAAFFKKPSTGAVCGRFFADQLGREIEIPRKRIPWVKYFFQFTLPAFLISIKATAQGNVKLLKKDTITNDVSVVISGNCFSQIQTPANMINPTLPLAFSAKAASQLALPEKLVVQPIADARTIKGKVVDDRGEPIVGATVVIKGTNKGTCTNAEGNFMITPEKDWKTVALWVSCVGYEIREIRVESRNTYINIALPVTLHMVTTGLVIVNKPSKKKQSREVPLLTKKIMDTAFRFFKVFPNPVSSGARMHIEWKQTEEGYFVFELLEVSGKKVYSEEIWIDSEARLLDLEVPSVRPGNYFLRATNKVSGKGFTEKIIVE
jgi:hypothetical protein